MNLNYEEFVSDFIETLKEFMPGVDIERAEVEKINETKDAIRVHLPEFGSVMPTAYLDDLYKTYQMGKSSENIAKELIQNMPAEVAKISGVAKPDKDTIKQNLFPCAINREMNKKLLDNVPHKDIEGTDLALIARCQMGEFGDHVATCMITNGNALALDMKPEEALKQAITNGKENKFVCKGISETIAEEMQKSGMPEEMTKELCCQRKDLFYVLTNEKNIQGAAVLAYPDEIKKAVKSIGEEKCYILPSSIHEVLLIPESITGGNPEQLADMVKDVNNSEVNINEQLSNHVYYFDGNSLSIADTQTLGKNLSNAPNAGKGLSKGAKKQEKSEGKTR